MRPTWTALFAALLVACDPATAVLLDGDALDDTANPDITDPDTEGDTTDPDGDTDPDPDTEADTEEPVRSWSGEREFTFEQWGGDCTETLVETGIEVTNDPSWSSVVAACEECEAVFLVDVDKDTLCASDWFDGYPVATQVLRGVRMRGDEVLVLAAQVDEPNDWERLARGEGDWGSFDYDYGGNVRTWQGDIAYDVEAFAELR